MTDFTKIGLTIASTRGGTVHSIGYNVLISEWEGVKVKLMELGLGTLDFREEVNPRGGPSPGLWKFVWVIMTNNTPITVLICLSRLNELSYPDIKFIPNEFP